MRLLVLTWGLLLAVLMAGPAHAAGGDHHPMPASEVQCTSHVAGHHGQCGDHEHQEHAAKSACCHALCLSAVLCDAPALALRTPTNVTAAPVQTPTVSGVVSQLLRPPRTA